MNIAAVSCSPLSYRLPAMGFGIWLTDKLGCAWVSAWVVHGMVFLEADQSHNHLNISQVKIGYSEESVYLHAFLKTINSSNIALIFDIVFHLPL